MHAEADQLGPVAVGSEYRAQHIRKIHSGEPEALAARHHRGQRERGHEAPQQPALPVHTRTFSSAASAWRMGTSRGFGESPCSRRASESAALMRPTWVNA